MAPSIKQRIEDLLDQLESPHLSDKEIEQVEKKLQILRAQAK